LGATLARIEIARQKEERRPKRIVLRATSRKIDGPGFDTANIDTTDGVVTERKLI
jgi:hypothetical protein